MNTTKLSIATLGKLTCLAALFSCASALASDAETTASATGGRGRTGSATATAHYEGDVGFARADTRTGAVNVARGVAVGVDENGLSLSLSLALAPLGGPALATNLNFSLGTNGEVATSIGNVVASGGINRAVTVGGRSSATPYGASATSLASGSTRGGGIVRAVTRSDHYEHREVRPIRVIRIR